MENQTYNFCQHGSSPRSVLFGGTWNVLTLLYLSTIHNLWRLSFEQVGRIETSCNISNSGLIRTNISVAWTPNLMNSARLHEVFQNFVVPWKIHLYKNLILSSDASRRDASNDKGCRCKFLPQMGPTTRLKIILKLQKIPKYEKIDYPPVNQASASDDRTWSGKHWQHTHLPGVHAQ